MKFPFIIILASILLIILIFLKFIFETKEGAYMALVNVGNEVNENTVGGYDIEPNNKSNNASNSDGNREWCMQRCLDRGDCQVVVVDSWNNCWLKNGIRGFAGNGEFNTYVKVPDS